MNKIQLNKNTKNKNKKDILNTEKYMERIVLCCVVWGLCVSHQYSRIKKSFV